MRASREELQNFVVPCNLLGRGAYGEVMEKKRNEEKVALRIIREIVREDEGLAIMSADECVR
jgi:hypothetical protein